MTGRLTLREIRELVLLGELGDVWITPSEIQRRLGLGGADFYRVALVLERLVVDGEAEIRRPGSRGKRWFRRRPPRVAIATHWKGDEEIPF